MSEIGKISAKIEAINMEIMELSAQIKKLNLQENDEPIINWLMEIQDNLTEVKNKLLKLS